MLLYNTHLCIHEKPTWFVAVKNKKELETVGQCFIFKVRLFLIWCASNQCILHQILGLVWPCFHLNVAFNSKCISLMNANVIFVRICSCYKSEGNLREFACIYLNIELQHWLRNLADLPYNAKNIYFPWDNQILRNQ